MQRRMSSISFKIQAFFVPQLQQPSFLSDAGSWLESCSSVTLSIYWLITSSRPVQKGRVKHCSHMGHSLVSLPFWTGLDEVINQYIDSVTLEQLARQLPTADKKEGCCSCGTKNA